MEAGYWCLTKIYSSNRKKNALSPLSPTEARPFFSPPNSPTHTLSNPTRSSEGNLNYTGPSNIYSPLQQSLSIEMDESPTHNSTVHVIMSHAALMI